MADTVDSASNASAQGAVQPATTPTTTAPKKLDETVPGGLIWVGPPGNPIPVNAHGKAIDKSTIGGDEPPKLLPEESSQAAQAQDDEITLDEGEEHETPENS